MNSSAKMFVMLRQLAKTMKNNNNAPNVTRHVNGAIKTVTAGASLDGKAAIVVTVDGSDTPAPYLDSYLTPVVGDIVRVQTVNGSPIVIGRVVGFPNF